MMHRDTKSGRENLLLKVSWPLPLKGQFGEGGGCMNRGTCCRWISDAEVGPVKKAGFCSGVL